jgi:Tfp pilus assembly protein PilV
MQRYRRNLGNQVGMTLVELLLATVIMAMIVAGSTRLWTTYSKAAKAHDTNEAIASEMTEAMVNLTRSWNVRTRPPGYTTSYTAANKGFTLLDADGQPCTSQCTQLVMNVTRSSGASENITIQTICQKPGKVTALDRLNGLSFSHLMASNCVVCGPGLLPRVRVTSDLSATANRTFPHNGASSPSSFRINSMLGMTMCFAQSGTGPIAIDQRAYLLDPKASTDALLDSKKTSVLPFDNFGNVRLESNL